MMGVARGARTVCAFRAHECTPVLVVLCRSLFVLFLFWGGGAFYYLLFFDLRHMNMHSIHAINTAIISKQIIFMLNNNILPLVNQVLYADIFVQKDKCIRHKLNNLDSLLTYLVTVKSYFFFTFSQLAFITIFICIVIDAIV